LPSSGSTTAPDLARRLGWLADYIRRSRQNYYLAEVLHAQREEGKTGLFEAIWHLIGGLQLAVRDTPARIRSWRAADRHEKGSFLLTESGDFLLTDAGDRILIEDGDRGQIVGSGDVVIAPLTAGERCGAVSWLGRRPGRAAERDSDSPIKARTQFWGMAIAAITRTAASAIPTQMER